MGGRHVALVGIGLPKNMHEPPLGILYVGGALRRAGFDVAVHHVLAEDAPLLAASIGVREPLFVGLSVITGAGISAAADFSRSIKQHCDAPVVWGNVHPTLLPDQCLHEEYIDIVCIGEGEGAAVELASALEAGSDLDGIRGIGFSLRDGGVRINPRRPPLEELDACHADWSFVDAQSYIAPSMGVARTLRVVTSRGCRFNCRFCSNPVLSPGGSRLHGAEQTLRHLRELVDREGVEGFYFSDDDFFADEERAWTILEGLGKPYYIKARTEMIDRSFADRLAATGCRAVSLGYESGSDRVLREVIDKNATVANHLRATAELSRHPQILIKGSFILGLPGETAAEGRQTIELACALLDISPNLTFVIGHFTPYPGTTLYRRAIASGFEPPRTTEGWDTFDRYSPGVDLPWVDWITSDEIESISDAMEVLTTLTAQRVPIFRRRVRDLIARGRYDSPLMRALNRFRTRYAFGSERRWRTKAVRFVVNVLLRRDHPLKFRSYALSKQRDRC